MLGVGVTGNPHHNIVLGTGTAGGTTASFTARANAENETADHQLDVPGDGSWYPAGGVARSTTYRNVYLYGIPGDTPNTDTVTFPSMATSFIAGNTRFDSAELSGQVFWPCFWDIDIGDGGFMAFAQGTPPWEIYPESILACPDLRTGFDPFLGDFWTENNGPFPAGSPPFQWRPRRRVYKAVAAPAGGLSIPVATHHYTKNIGAI